MGNLSYNYVNVFGFNIFFNIDFTDKIKILPGEFDLNL